MFVLLLPLSASALTLSSDELLPIPGTTELRTLNDGTVCFDFPWIGEICFGGGSCPEGDCGLNGTLVDGLTHPIAGPSTAVTLPTGERLRIPGTTELRTRSDGSVCFAFPWIGEICTTPTGRRGGDCPIEDCGTNGTLVDGLTHPIAGPSTAVTLPTGERLPIPAEPAPPADAVRFNPDGSMCIDFPWGEVCSPPTGTGCPQWGCGENGTRVTGLVREIDAGRKAITLPSGERMRLR